MNIESIMKRKSIRNYDGELIKKADLEKLKTCIDELNNKEGIFGNKIRISYVENNSVNIKLGTYGVIAGAHSYVAAACKKSDYNLEDLGYQLEKLVLFATQMGLATVWLGGTFGRSGFAKAIDLEGDEVLPIVSPVGYEGGRKSFFGHIIKSKAGNRKPWSELFFDGKFEASLSPDDEFAEVLEGVRQAPSARNMQPWRIVKDGKNFHFYSAGKIEMNRIDMGIALCHFDLAAEEKGFPGTFRIQNPGSEGKYKYLVSWKQA